MLLVSTVTGAWLYTDHLDDIAHIAEARLATFSPSGQLLAGVSSDNRITLWNTSTFEQVNALAPHAARVMGVGWSPDGNRIASLDQAGHIAVWRPDSVTSILRMRLLDATQIAWSREGTYLAAKRLSVVFRSGMQSRGERCFLCRITVMTTVTLMCCGVMTSSFCAGC